MARVEDESDVQTKRIRTRKINSMKVRDWIEAGMRSKSRVSGTDHVVSKKTEILTARTYRERREDQFV